MEKELSELKKTLISLVVSSPATMTVRSLLKDYRSMVGGVLPLAKFGYREPVQFLMERCTDIFVVEGPSSDPILTPIVTKNIAHIDRMVRRQTLPSSVKHRGKRRSVLLPNEAVEANVKTCLKPTSKSSNRYDTVNKYDASKINNASKQYESKQVLREPEIVKQFQNLKINPVKNVHYNMNEFASKHTDSATNTSHNITEKDNMHSDSVEESCHSSALERFYKKRLPRYTSDMDFTTAEAGHSSKGGAQTGRQSSSNTTSMQAKLYKLKTEITTLIKDNAEGVWCTDLLGLYMEKYGRKLNFNHFGYTSIISLVYSIEDRVHISRPVANGDWFLQNPDGAAAIESAAQTQRAPGPVLHPAPRHAPRPAPRLALQPAEPEDALPGVDYEPDVFPADCVHYLDRIPPAGLQGLVGGAQVEVVVGEVYSPSHFWMLRVGPQYNLAMEVIMDEMALYYNGEGAFRVLARGALRVGHHCAALFERDWHRAVIVQLIDSDTVKVRHVDYGTVEQVAAGSLKPLRREWAVLPAQAVRSRLAAVRPAGADWRWSRSACAAFLNLVCERRLYAHLAHVAPEVDEVETFLIDTNGAKDVCITRELIRVGHADQRYDSALRREECYLYPRFESLESGATPNYADICRILADGLRLEYVSAYRANVPGPWARSQPPSPSATATPPVRLTETEWKVLSHLRATDPTAAHWFLLKARHAAARRALRPASSL